MPNMASSYNIDRLQDLLEFQPRLEEGGEVDLADPPCDANGKLICARKRLRGGGPCGNPVGIPWTSCGAMNRSIRSSRRRCPVPRPKGTASHTESRERPEPN